MYKYFYIIIYFLFFPISIYAYDKDINHIYENQLKEAKPLLERYCDPAVENYCHDTIRIIDLYVKALKSCFNDNLSNSENIADELNTINMYDFPSSEHTYHEPYKELSFILINSKLANKEDNVLSQFEHNFTPYVYPPGKKNVVAEHSANTYFELYIILAYALNKYNKIELFKIYKPDFLKHLEQYKYVLDKDEYKLYKKMFLKYENSTEIINRFFQLNDLKIDDSIPYNDLNAHSKIKRNLYNAFFHAEKNEVIKKRINSIKISTELNNYSNPERLYYIYLHKLSKNLVDEKKQLLSDVEYFDEDIYLKLRFNTLYLFYMVVSNQPEEVINSQYAYVSKMLKKNKNKLIKDYKNKVVPYNFYDIFSEFIESIVQI